MPILLSPNIQRGNQQLFVKQAPQNNAASNAVVEVLLSPGKSLSRKVLNALTFNLYDKFVENPRQWRGFKNALIASADYQQLSNNTNRQQMLDDILATYSHHSALTRTKAVNILADFQAVSNENKTAVKAKQAPLNESQSFVARGLKTLYEHARPLHQKERQLLQQAREPQIPTDKRKAVEQVLKPGHGMSSAPILRGQQAIKTRAQKQQMAFEYTNIGVHFLQDPLSTRLQSILTSGQSKIKHLQTCAENGQRAILSIPLGLKDTSGILTGLKEDHVVELAIDFNNKKVLYLDSKALPLEQATKHYAGSGNMRQSLENFGHQLFDSKDQSWNASLGVLELSLPKQQGANDCGAFTHQFTQRLCDGESIGDIERAFNAQDRANLRTQLAQSILVDNFNDGDEIDCIAAGGGNFYAPAPSNSNTIPPDSTWGVDGRGDDGDDF